MTAHGTNSRYTLRCRCRPCRDAHAAYSRAWKRGEVGGTQDAAAAQAAIREYLRTHSLRQLSMATGLHIQTAANIASGKATSIQHRTAAKIARLVSA